MHACLLSCCSVVCDPVTPRTAARQAPLSMGFSRREYWRELPSLSPGNLPDPGVEPMSPASPALKTDSLLSKPPEKPMNTGVGSLSLLQGIFPTQESNWGLTHCRQILYRLSHEGSLRILEWVAYPFSGGSSQHRNQTGVSCIAGRFFTS